MSKKTHAQDEATKIEKLLEEKRENLLGKIMANDIFSDNNKFWAVHAKTKRKFRNNKRYFFSADVALDAATRTKLQGVWHVYRENENGIRVLKFHAKADKKGRFSIIFSE